MAKDSVSISNTGDIGRSVASAMDSHFKSLESELGIIATEIETLKNNFNQRMYELFSDMASIEMSKYESRKNVLQDHLKRVEKISREMKKEADREMGEIQILYDKAIFEVLDGLTQTIKANTKNLDVCKGDYIKVSEQYNSFYSDLAGISYIHAYPYYQAMKNLFDNLKDVVNNFNMFLDYRKKTVELIESLQHDIPVKGKVVKVYVPVWVAGMLSPRGEEVIIYPPSEYVSPSRMLSLSEPYAEHIAPHHVYNFLKFLMKNNRFRLSPEDRKNAVKHSILPKAGKILPLIEKMSGKSIYRDKKSFSIFTEAIRRFVARRS